MSINQNPIKQRGALDVTVLVILTLVIALAGLIFFQVNNSDTEIQNSTTNSTEATPSDVILMTVEYLGGLCPEGTCSSSYNLYENGNFEGSADLDDAELTELSSVIDDTDFLSYKPREINRCPSEFDGSDTVLIFPQKYDDQSFTLCQLDIQDDDESVNFILDLIDSKAN